MQCGAFFFHVILVYEITERAGTCDQTKRKYNIRKYYIYRFERIRYNSEDEPAGSEFFFVCTGKIIAGTPMGRFGEVEELVGSTLFLVSDRAAGFITGVVLPIDGGFSSYSGV